MDKSVRLLFNVCTINHKKVLLQICCVIRCDIYLQVYSSAVAMLYCLLVYIFYLPLLCIIQEGVYNTITRQMLSTQITIGYRRFIMNQHGWTHLNLGSHYLFRSPSSKSNFHTGLDMKRPKSLFPVHHLCTWLVFEYRLALMSSLKLLVSNGFAPINHFQMFVEFV